MTRNSQRWVDCSNEILHHPDEESGPILREGIPFQKSFQKVDVKTDDISQVFFVR